MNVAEQIASLIPVKHCFLLPGGGNQPLVEAFRSRAVPVLHEHTAAVAAEAYAQITGLGCALVTTGPGVTNAMTGLAAAWLDSTPLVLLSGQVKQEYMATGGLRQRGFQELPSTELTKPITKMSGQLGVYNLNSRVGLLLNAINLAQSPRMGPVHIDVPLDVQTAEAVEGHPGITATWVSKGVQAATDAAERCAELLSKSERPVLLIGNGCRGEGVRELLESIGLPVLLTWRAADFLEEDHPLFCGRPGIAGQRGANIVQQSADLLICVGARLDLGQTGYDVSLFAPKATKFVVDVDADEAAKHCVEPMSRLSDATGKWEFEWKDKWNNVVCDGRQFLQALAEKSTNKGKPWFFGAAGISGYWLTEWGQWCLDTHERYRPRNAFYDALSDALRPDDVIVAGSSGTASESTLQHIRIKRGQRLVCSHGLGSMGFCLPAAIGAYYATGKRVVCIEGDGSFAMNAYELETVRRLNLPIKVFVVRNGGYASIVRTQRNAGHGECVPSVPDPIQLSKTLGITSRCGNMQKCIDNAMREDGSSVVAVDVPCELSSRMRTQPPGKPECMLPELGDAEYKDATRYCR